MSAPPLPVVRRLFFALPVPGEVAGALQQTLPREWGLRRVEALEDFHLTVKFLGNTDVPVERILAAVQAVMPGFVSEWGVPPRFTARAVGVFPNAATDQCRIFWGDLERGEQGSAARHWLQRLVRVVDDSLAALDPDSRWVRGEPFVPHITIARRGSRPVSIAEGEGWVENWREVTFGDWIPDSLALYETVPDDPASVARFRIVGEIPLKDALD